MGYTFDAKLCKQCPFGYCVKLSEKNGRNIYELKQVVGVKCTFYDRVPEFERDAVERNVESAVNEVDFEQLLSQYKENLKQAGKELFSSNFKAVENAYSKVGGYAYEVLIGYVLWNVAAVWNQYMLTGSWESTLVCPQGVTPTEENRVAIFKLPNGFDTTSLLNKYARQTITDLDKKLKDNNMLSPKLSAPDFIGVRLPDIGGRPSDTQASLFDVKSDSDDDNYAIFNKSLKALDEASLNTLQNANNAIVGKLSGHDLLFALAIKHSTRSDRLYQPLFEANVLKYFIEGLLKETRFRFYAFIGNGSSGAVERHYRAASLVSLMSNSLPKKAIDGLYKITTPTALAQFVLTDIARFFSSAK